MSFVQVAWIEEGWRPLDAGGAADAQRLIDLAEAWIRDPARRPDLPFDDPTAARVVVEVVRAAIGTSQYAGHLSYTKEIGPWTRGGTFASPGGGLIFTDEHARQLGLLAHPAPQWHFGDGCPPP